MIHYNHFNKYKSKLEERRQYFIYFKQIRKEISLYCFPSLAIYPVPGIQRNQFPFVHMIPGFLGWSFHMLHQSCLQIRKNLLNTTDPQTNAWSDIQIFCLSCSFHYIILWAMMNRMWLARKALTCTYLSIHVNAPEGIPFTNTCPAECWQGYFLTCIIIII